MAQVVAIEDSLYDEIKVVVEKDPISFPTIKNFVDRAVQKELKNLKESKE